MYEDYIPNPEDTSDITLSDDLIALCDAMSENIHEVWSASRIADNWSYRPLRNDALKHHNCLVPYDQLPDSEKEYDRRNCMETIKLILKLGYEIKK